MISAATRLDRLVLYAGLILFLAISSAPASTNSAWFTRVWNTYDGLLNDQVGAIVPSGDGYLWVVLPVGLMRFDGVRFSQFPLENYTSPTDNHVGTVLRGRTGVLWIAMYGGTVIGLKPDFATVPIPQTALPKRTPFALAEDKKGALWLAYDGVVCRIKDGQVARFGAKEGMPEGQFDSMVNDGAGNIWLAKGNQICVFRDGRFRQTATMQDVRKLAATTTNAVWFIAGNRLFHCDVDGVLQDEGAFAKPGGARGNALLEDHMGAVWISTDGSGLIRFDGAGFEKIQTSYPNVLGLAEDREGNLWAGTLGGGLDRISSSGVQLETLECGGTLEQVQSISEDSKGRLWGVAYSGMPYHGLLVSLANGRWTPVLTNAPFNGTVTCVAADDCGAVWIGTLDGKLLRLTDANGLMLVQNTPYGAISALLSESNGDVWMVVGGQRLQRLHAGQLQEVQFPRPVRRISAMAEDAAGNLWVGAWNIVLRFDGTNFIDESSRLPIAGRRVNCLYGTPDGSMWISDSGLGLLRFKNGRVDHVGIEQGLFDDYIAQIVADGRGWLWFAGDHGIFKVRQHELEQAMQDHSLHLRPVVYGRNESLPSLAALVSAGVPFALPHALCSHDGRVWLLTKMGVVVANPKLLPENSIPTQVLLTRVEMDGQTIASYGEVALTQTVANLAMLNDPLRLPPSHRHLEFDFTAFHFSAPENVRFRYQLAGFDNDWIDAETERHADYSRLTAGNYQFQVEACIGDGPWSQPAALVFTVAPFFWQTWWFRLGTLVMFTSFVIAIVRYLSLRRMRLKLRAAEQQAAIERERARIARDIHDDLGNRLTEIQLLSGLAQDDCAMQNNSVAGEISSAARQATDALDEIVWAINPRNDTLPRLINYLGQFAVEFLCTAGIRCRVDLPEQPPDKLVSAEVRHNLFLVIKESLNNIVRHANASEVFVLILVTDESISVIIEDNGCGFNGEAKYNGGDGLANMRQRIAEIGGQFQIKSKPGAGTSLSFNGPWLARK